MAVGLVVGGDFSKQQYRTVEPDPEVTAFDKIVAEQGLPRGIFRTRPGGTPGHHKSLCRQRCRPEQVLVQIETAWA